MRGNKFEKSHIHMCNQNSE